MNIRPRSLDSCFWKKWQGTHFCYLLLFWSALACQAQTTVQEAVQVRNGIAFSMSGKVERSKDSTNTLAQISTSKVREKSPAPALVLTQPGSSLTTGADGAASVVVGSAGFARMGADTTIRLPDAHEKNQSLELLKGQLFMNISAEEIKKHKGTEFRLKTPACVLAVKGTKFFAVSKDGSDTVGVHEGSVSVTEPASKTTAVLAAGQAVTITSGSISHPRAINKGEGGYAVQYDAATPVQTPAPLWVVKGSTNFIFENGRRTVVMGGLNNSYAYIHWTDLDGKKDGKAVTTDASKIGGYHPVSPILTANGTVHYLWNRNAFSYQCIACPGFPPGGDRAIAVQFHVRAKNITIIGVEVGNSSTVLAPSDPAHPDNAIEGMAYKHGCISINIDQSQKPDGKRPAPGDDTAELEFSNIMLLLPPK